MANYVFKNISAFNINDSIIKVSTLPTESINPNAIYMIVNSKTGDKTYHQYRNDAWIELVDSSLASGEDMLQETINATKSTQFLFNRYIGDNVDFISGLDTSQVTNMKNMFEYCTNLTTIPPLDTSSAENMRYMFSECTKLTTIPPLDTSSATSIQAMFSQCALLTKISNIKINSYTDAQYAFQYCTNLIKIDILFYDIKNTTYCAGMARNCPALKSFIIRSFGANYVLNSNSFTSSGIANGTGYIYVPRDMVDTLKSATNWSTYAEQIRALEYYTVDGTTTGELDETKI